MRLLGAAGGTRIAVDDARARVRPTAVASRRVVRRHLALGATPVAFEPVGTIGATGQLVLPGLVEQDREAAGVVGKFVVVSDRLFTSASLLTLRPARIGSAAERADAECT